MRSGSPAPRPARVRIEGDNVGASQLPSNSHIGRPLGSPPTGSMCRPLVPSSSQPGHLNLRASYWPERSASVHDTVTTWAITPTMRSASRHRGEQVLAGSGVEVFGAPIELAQDAEHLIEARIDAGGRSLG